MCVCTYNIHTLCVAVVLSTVVNRSDVEQQFDGHNAIQKHTLFMLRVLSMPLMSCVDTYNTDA